MKIKYDMCDINPAIKGTQANYFLNIYHDVAIDELSDIDLVINNSSPGHFYIGVVEGELVKSYGFNPDVPWKILAANGRVRSEDDRLKRAKKYEVEKSQNILCTKSIPLTYDQYHLAKAYINKWEGVTQTYTIGLHDCTDFVQEVYHETGLSLYFTKVFTKQELSDLGTEVRFKVMSRYGARDCFPEMFINMEGESIEAISRKLNIPCEQIVETTNNIAFLAFHDSLAITNRYFSVFLNDQDYKLPSEIMQPINVVDAAEQADFIKHFILSDTQASKAKNTLTDFFTNSINSYSQNASHYPIPAHILFPEISDETRNEIEQLVNQSTRIFDDLDLADEVTSNSFIFSSERAPIIDEDEVKLIQINDELELD